MQLVLEQYKEQFKKYGNNLNATAESVKWYNTMERSKRKQKYWKISMALHERNRNEKY